MKLLDAVRKGEMFRTGLEIGCAGGLFTEILAQRCKMLLVLDISPVALGIARRRCQRTGWVRFKTFDLRVEDIPGTFDLIIVAGVLEYFSRPATFFQIRQKIVDALEPGGYLLMESTRRRPLEDSWWGRRLIRGKWINVFIGQHPSLSVKDEVITDAFAITLFQKIERNPVQ
jgi:SAM-dependent methyltransferase